MAPKSARGQTAHPDSGERPVPVGVSLLLGKGGAPSSNLLDRDPHKKIG